MVQGLPRAREAGAVGRPLDAVPAPARAVAAAEGRQVAPEAPVAPRGPHAAGPPGPRRRRRAGHRQVGPGRPVTRVSGLVACAREDAAGAAEDAAEAGEDAVPPARRQAPRVPPTPARGEGVTRPGPQRAPPAPTRVAWRETATRGFLLPHRSDHGESGSLRGRGTESTLKVPTPLPRQPTHLRGSAGQSGRRFGLAGETHSCLFGSFHVPSFVVTIDRSRR